MYIHVCVELCVYINICICIRCLYLSLALATRTSRPKRKNGSADARDCLRSAWSP